MGWHKKWTQARASLADIYVTLFVSAIRQVSDDECGWRVSGRYKTKAMFEK